MPAGSAPGNPNGSFLVSVNNPTTVSWSATVVGSLGSVPAWLDLGTTSGSSTSSQPGTISFSIDRTAAAALAPGAYYGRIEVTSSDISNSPQDFEVVLNVTAANAPAAPDPEPGGLLFITTVGGAPFAQTVTVYSGSPSASTFQTSAATTDGNRWLSVSPGTGSASAGSPGITSVSVKYFRPEGRSVSGRRELFSLSDGRQECKRYAHRSQFRCRRGAGHFGGGFAHRSAAGQWMHSLRSCPGSNGTGKQFLRAGRVAHTIGDPARERLRFGGDQRPDRGDVLDGDPPLALPLADATRGALFGHMVAAQSLFAGGDQPDRQRAELSGRKHSDCWRGYQPQMPCRCSRRTGRCTASIRWWGDCWRPAQLCPSTDSICRRRQPSLPAFRSQP